MITEDDIVEMARLVPGAGHRPDPDDVVMPPDVEAELIAQTLRREALADWDARFQAWRTWRESPSNPLMPGDERIVPNPYIRSLTLADVKRMRSGGPDRPR